MCGGAIISDIIPPYAAGGRVSRRMIDELLWLDQKKPLSNKSKHYSKPVVVDLDDDFESDFQEFKDQSDVDEDEDVLLDVKPFAFTASNASARPKKQGLSRDELLWLDQKKPLSNKSKHYSKPVVVDLDDDFESDFQEFKDQSDVDEDEDDYDLSGFVEEKPIMTQFGLMGSNPANEDTGIKSFAPTDNVPMYFNSDQGSNSFDCSDFGWGEQAVKTPEISSGLAPTPEVDESFFEDSNPQKKLKSNSHSAVPVQENNGKTLSEELLAFDNPLMNFQMPNLDGNWEASLDRFLNGDGTQDSGNAMDLWSFDDFPSMSWTCNWGLCGDKRGICLGSESWRRRRTPDLSSEISEFGEITLRPRNKRNNQ
ncbi:hypothetical protein Tsubulata_028093 [Turnera subulata]|uniref:Uncharacterized protein n=1 Tax=Turnera subulata TaxID=218843 RepID=A0A9Q0JDT5_9ROSI|nr:hypothetical protein Tsubulata_028093 [Turnera subulata]